MRTSICLFSLAFLGTMAAWGATGHDGEALAHARQLQLEFRQGNVQVVDSLVKGLETAVKKSPDNADLWRALGDAYMSQQGSMYMDQPDPAALLAVGERARDAYARALTMDKDSAHLRASHGMARFSISMLKQDSPGLMESIEEMNSAVRQAPNSTPVRLTRGFTIIHLPVGVRDTRAVTDDLKFTLDVASGGRAEDVLHVLLGDVYAETGELDAARNEYRQVTGASRFAADEIRSRLDDLKTGAISPASIGRVRAGTGAQCAMCHAPGADN